MHRNAEIWEKRHERLEDLRVAMNRQFGMAADAPLSGLERGALRTGWESWLKRFSRIERRVWRALCAAKGWRKA